MTKNTSKANAMTDYLPTRKIHPIGKIVGNAPFTVHYVKDGRIKSFAETFSGNAFDVRNITNKLRYALHDYSGGCGAVWAEDRDGLILTGIDGQGNRCDHDLTANLESIRDWHRRNAS